MVKNQIQLRLYLNQPVTADHIPLKKLPPVALMAFPTRALVSVLVGVETAASACGIESRLPTVLVLAVSSVVVAVAVVVVATAGVPLLCASATCALYALMIPSSCALSVREVSQDMAFIFFIVVIYACPLGVVAPHGPIISLRYFPWNVFMALIVAVSRTPLTVRFALSFTLKNTWILEISEGLLNLPGMT